MMNEQDQAELSAFLDDEAADVARVCALLKSEQGRAVWARQCQIRDALRGESTVASDHGVADKVRLALADEPVVFAPRKAAKQASVGSPVPRHRQFAGLALAATVAGVAFLGLTQVDQGPPGQVADAQGSTATMTFPPVNGIGGAVIESDVRPVTRLVTDEPESLDSAVDTDPVAPAQP